VPADRTRRRRRAAKATPSTKGKDRNEPSAWSARTLRRTRKPPRARQKGPPHALPPVRLHACPRRRHDARLFVTGRNVVFVQRGPVDANASTGA
jgi:hypothetical protein